jgi:hypothetical protein
MRGKITRPGAGIINAGASIRNGIKTDRDTQPVQVRMLKAQIAVLKQIAALEGCTTSDIIRFLVDGYIDCCLRDWPEGDAKEILFHTVDLNEYRRGEVHPSLSMEDAVKMFGPQYADNGDMACDVGGPVEPYERYTEGDAK